MNNIELVFQKAILHNELVPFILTILSVVLIILITGVLVKKELKEGSKKNEK